jgi:hypothetical protein
VLSTVSLTITYGVAYRFVGAHPLKEGSERDCTQNSPSTPNLNRRFYNFNLNKSNSAIPWAAVHGRVDITHLLQAERVDTLPEDLQVDRLRKNLMRQLRHPLAVLSDQNLSSSRTRYVRLCFGGSDLSYLMIFE